MKKSCKLYDLFESIARDEIKEEFTIEYQRGDGWYLNPLSPLYFDDTGIFLGTNYEKAVEYMDSRDFRNIVG